MAKTSLTFRALLSRSTKTASMSTFLAFLALAISLLSSQASAQIISPTNSLSPQDPVLQLGVSWQTNRYTILPLVASANLRSTEFISGSPIKINPNTAQIPSQSVAFISCDSSAYEQGSFVGPIDALAATIGKSPVAIVLYSDPQNGCSYTPGSRVPAYYYRLYTLAVPAANASIFVDPSGKAGLVTIARMAFSDNNSSNSGPPTMSGTSVPGGPSPSTAVAMIILYSITGVITALFLIIIVTGAIRAHRHPERYGPRNTHGRTRQSRARGLARAMLETLPIVKFGEKDETKPSDVEMAAAATAEAKTVRDSTFTEADGEHSATEGEIKDAKTNNGEQSGAEQSSETSVPTPVADEALGCSICTDDFEIGQDVRVLPCNHNFHPACIDPWLLNVSGTCPLCRIDLRPATAEGVEESGTVIHDADVFPPPLDPAEQARRASRRHSLIWDILNPNRMRDASAQERIAALRRVREERRLSNAEETEARRRRRLTARFHDVFHIRTTGTATSQPEGIPETNSTGVVCATDGFGLSPIERISEIPSSDTAGPSTSTPSTTSDWPVVVPKASTLVHDSKPSPPTPSPSSPRAITPVSATPRPEPASPSAVALPPSPTNIEPKDHKDDKL